MTHEIGIIVGSAHTGLELDIRARSPSKTPFGLPSSPILSVSLGGRSVACIFRHGERATIPPHAINYRANIWALQQHGVRRCVALNTVGVIDPSLPPGGLAVPDQLIDYTWGRQHTYYDGENGDLVHVDFTEPFDPVLRGQIAESVRAAGFPIRSGVYGVTQGPRLETAAEIDRLERDGCTMVGMTAMPEAVLARELSVDYAVLALAVNCAAGRGGGSLDIHGQMERYVSQGLTRVSAVLERLIPELCEES